MPIMPNFTLNEIDSMNDSKKMLVELASALNYEGVEWSQLFEKVKVGDMKFHGQFDLKKVGSGDVASNLRYKHDKDRNNLVVQNTMEVLEFFSKNSQHPLVITSFPRDQRYKTFKFLEGGSTVVLNKSTRKEIVEESLQMNNFIQKYLDLEKISELRESTKGARYNSYLADMISFILMMNHHYNPEIFEEVIRRPCVFNTERVGLVGRNMLRPFVKDGKEWIPKKGFDYLYFEEVYNPKDGIKFSVPKDGTIGKVYHQLKDLISLEENEVKCLLRKFMNDFGGYKRFSDYWVNDVDDGLTLLLIKNAYSYCDLTENDKKITEQIDRIITENFKN
tara:strand:- start:791 stop:1792 length:1002 start_codon:yes stop_codon:yes gene_type:complete